MIDSIPLLAQAMRELQGNVERRIAARNEGQDFGGQMTDLTLTWYKIDPSRTGKDRNDCYAQGPLGARYTVRLRQGKNACYVVRYNNVLIGHESTLVDARRKAQHHRITYFKE